MKLLTDTLDADQKKLWDEAMQKVAVKAARQDLLDHLAKQVEAIDAAVASDDDTVEDTELGFATVLDVVKLELRHKAGKHGRPIEVDGRDHFVMRHEDLRGFVDTVQKAVELGKMDDALSAAGAASINDALPPSMIHQNNRHKAAWTPEKRAAQAEKIRAARARMKAEKQDA